MELLMTNNRLKLHRLIFYSERKISNYIDFHFFYSVKIIYLKNFVKKLNNLSFENKLISILNYVEFNMLQRLKVPLKIGNKELAKLILKRNVKQILDNGFIGCTDLAIVCQYVFYSLGYKTKLIFAVSEYFESNVDVGHTLLLLDLGDDQYIIDCSLKCITKKTIETTVLIPSIYGDLLVFAECYHPQYVNLNCINDLTQNRNFFFTLNIYNYE